MPRTHHAWIVEKDRNKVLLYIPTGLGRPQQGATASVHGHRIKEYYRLHKLIHEAVDRHGWYQYWEAETLHKQRTHDNKTQPYNPFDSPKIVTEEQADDEKWHRYNKHDY